MNIYNKRNTNGILNKSYYMINQLSEKIKP